MIIEKILNETGLLVGSQIRANSGVYVDVMQPVPGMFHIEDIAHALSMQPRFAGHLNVKYTVAQHCLEVVEWLRLNNHSKSTQLEGLMHDASEAYLIDVPSPIKRHLFNYQDIERDVMEAIHEKFGIQPIKLSWNAVHEADRYMLGREWHEFVMRSPVLEPIVVLRQKQAKQKFLQMFKKLTS